MLIKQRQHGFAWFNLVGVVLLMGMTDAFAAGVQETVLGQGAWGRLAALPNNGWLAVVTRFSRTEPSRLAFYESTNAGRVWSAKSELREPGRKFDNGHLLRISNTVMLVTGRSLVDGQSYHLPVYESVDGGISWQRLGSADTSEGEVAAQKKGLWEPWLFLLPDGKLSMIYSNEKHAGYSQVLSQKISGDGGRTWGPERRIVEQPGGGKLRPGMGVVTRLRDGRFLLVYEVVGMGRGLVHGKISRDGVEWPDGLGAPVPGHEAAPFVTILTDGRLLLTSCSNTLSISEDSGKSWKLAGDLSRMPQFKYTWPALYEIQPGELVTVVSDRGVKLRFDRIRP